MVLVHDRDVALKMLRQAVAVGRASALLVLVMIATAGLGSALKPAPILAQTDPVARSAALPTVVVVPFSNISRGPDDEWLGLGIAESIVADLSRREDVQVLGLGPVLAALENAGVRSDSEVLRVSRALGADFLVTGGFQRVGDQMRSTARVLNVETATVIHTAKIDGMVTELFMLEDRLGAEMSRGLAQIAQAEEDAELAAARAPSPIPTPTPTPTPVPTPTARVEATGEPPAVSVAAVPRGGGFAPPPTALIDGPAPPAAPDTIARDTAGRATVRAVRLTGPWRLDGALDEVIYAEVPAFSDFIQQEPDEGAAATERTEMWVFYDDAYVYVSARLWETASPSEWVANDMRRDSFQIVSNDNFGIVLDTFYDRRNGVAFMVNPIAGFFDFQITDEGNPNTDWNPVWDVRTGTFDGGWSVEMQIPFKSIRYQPGAEQVWGFQAARSSARKNETSHITPVSISAGPGVMRLSAAATLVGVEAPDGGTNLEVKPYVTGSSATDLTADPAILNRGDGDVGVDVKYGVTQNLTADFTYNTDFAQVEVDQQQVNLTRFSLFFPEKREFFLEGRGIFDFGRSAGAISGRPGGGGARRVGGGDFGGTSDVPTIFFSRRIGLAGGHTVPILGGGRLTGKAGKFSIGALNIQTDDAPEADALTTNFTVVRIKRDILRRSRVGAIFTGRSVSSVGDGSNEVYGIDAAFSFYDNVNFNGYYAQSRTPGLAVDDASYQAAFNYSGDLYSLKLDHLLVGDNFSPEVGFLRRSDFRRTFASFDFKPRPQGIRAVRQFTWGGSLDYIENGAGQVETRTAQLRFNTELENSDLFSVDVMRNYELLVDPFTIASDVTIPVGAYDFQDINVAYSLGAQRRVSGNVSIQRGEFFDGDITAAAFSSGRIEVTPQLSVEPSISINRVDLPVGGFTAKLMAFRSTYTFTPRMFFGGLVQYNSGNDSVSSNLRLRWEYQPGSELFVVYTDQRDTTLRGVPILENRAFIVKVNRLFRF